MTLPLVYRWRGRYVFASFSTYGVFCVCDNPLVVMFSDDLNLGHLEDFQLTTRSFCPHSDDSLVHLPRTPSLYRELCLGSTEVCHHYSLRPYNKHALLALARFHFFATV